MDQAHFDARSRPSGASLLPLGTAGVAYAAAEDWDYSNIVIPNSPSSGLNWEPYLQMIGGQDPTTNPASIGLIFTTTMNCHTIGMFIPEKSAISPNLLLVFVLLIRNPKLKLQAVHSLVD